MPFHRAWALAHEKTWLDFDAPEWAPCAAWLRCSVAPLFTAVSARYDETTGRMTLRHPRLAGLAIDPDNADDRARLNVIERVERCNATKCNPVTGIRDAETLGALETHYGYKDFGVYCEVIEGGPVAEGDPDGLD